MGLWLIFDWVLMAFLAGSGIHKLLGKEKEAVKKLGFDYKWVYLIGSLQLISLYFVYMKIFLPVVVMVGAPLLLVAVRTTQKEDYAATTALVVIASMVMARWLIFTDII